MAFLSAAASAESQYSLLDSINVGEKGITVLSLEASDQDVKDGVVEFNGAITSSEVSPMKFVPVRVAVSKLASEQVKLDGPNLWLTDDRYLYGNSRDYKSGKVTFKRYAFLSKDDKTVITMSDDPGPIIAIAGLAAASTVVFCGHIIHESIKNCSSGFSVDLDYALTKFSCKVRCDKN